MKEKTKQDYLKLISRLSAGNPFAGPLPLDTTSIFVPINIIFNPGTDRGVPCGPYIENREYKNDGFPPLIGAVTKDNEIMLKIDLNYRRENITENFQDLITVLRQEMQAHGKLRSQKKKRQYEIYWKVYRLRENDPKKWTFEKIANEVFPGDTDIESAMAKVKRFYKEAKAIIKK